MTYSLARWRTSNPAPPFGLAGTLAGDDHLRDAAGVVSLTNARTVEHDARDGDLIEVTVTAVTDQGVTIERLEVVARGGPGFRLPHRPRAGAFTALVRVTRDFLIARGLDEVFSPGLVVCPGTEPALEAFSTEVTYGRSTRRAYLPTSPEIALKKALASGWTDIFEIKPCYRRGEYSTHHANEFTMLEWYRGFADLDLIEADVRALTTHLADAGLITRAEVITTDFATLFDQEFGFTLKPTTDARELRELADRLGVETRAEENFDDVFHRVMIDRLEPRLAARGPAIVRRFPPSQAALAKLDANGWADRFEFYWNGLEIANAFNEVSDFTEQARRWQNDLAERARRGTEPLPLDGELIVALRAGSPPAGGVALGLERLFMAGTGVDRIAELRLFDELRPGG